MAKAGDGEEEVAEQVAQEDPPLALPLTSSYIRLVKKGAILKPDVEWNEDDDI